jgi:hypothetical protein
MEKVPANNKKLLKSLNDQIKVLQEKLVEAEKREGKDAYIEVKVKKNQGRYEKVKQKGKADKAEGKFYLELEIATKQADVYIPLSIASGKKTAGFMYQIEGTDEGSIVSAEVRVRGEGVSQVMVGTLTYAKVSATKKAAFEIRSVIKGKPGKAYKLVFTRINYKLNISEARYQQYLKEISSEKVTLS